MKSRSSGAMRRRYASCSLRAAIPARTRRANRSPGLDQVEHSLVFHAGTALQDGQIVTNGGRLLGVTGVGRDITEAREIAYADIEKIRYEGKHYRTDIALKALQAMKG